MEQLQKIDGYEITRNYEMVALHDGDEVILEENTHDLGEVLLEDVGNEKELEESASFLKKEIVGDLREKGVPANVGIAFAEWAIWVAKISRGF